jgi:hypothetical protein
MSSGTRLSQKVRFIAAATEEVIQIGAGLTTFADFFTAHRGENLNDHVATLIRSGVKFRCLIADPSSPGLRAYALDREEPGYRHDISDSIQKVRAVRERLSSLTSSGGFEVYLYQRLPMFAATCVDIGEGPPSPRGRMSVSNYLPGVSRADSPVLRFSHARTRAS